MNAENLLYLPRGAKILSLLILISALVFSGFITLYYLFWVDVESTFVLAALSVFQLTSTGAAIAIVAFSSKSSFGREALLNETSKWLTRELVSSLERIDLPFERDSSSWSSTKTMDDISKCFVKVDHVVGTSSAFYEITAFDIKIMMRVTLNSYRFIVLIYVEELLDKDTAELQKAMEMVTFGAEAVGFITKFTKSPAVWNPSVELHEAYCFKEVPKDFLYNGTERLFWSQDIATMLRSTMLQLKRHGWITNSDVAKSDEAGKISD